MELNGVEFNKKPILIEETRSQPKQKSELWPEILNSQNLQNLPPSKKPQKNLPPIWPKQNTYNNYSDAFKPRKKTYFFLIASLKT